MKIDEILKAKFKNEHHRAAVNIRYTSNWMGAYQNKQLAEFDLSLPQFNILRILRGAGEELSIKVVKDRMLEKSPNTTRLIDKLIAKDLVDRRRCKDDRRVVFVSITAEGRKVLEKIDDVFHEMSFESSLSEKEAKELNALLDKLRGGLS
ncbi:MAG: MarR family transcriptional regulator [Brumimicrobium sp.]|nr:MarR family transcriptional regulator [Brumimicrobium sp.]